MFYTCLSFCPQGGAGGRQTPPGKQTPLASRHTPLWADRNPWQAEAPPGKQTHPSPGRHTFLGRQPPSRTATAANGTHPTGMHSCLYFIVEHILLENGIWVSILFVTHQHTGVLIHSTVITSKLTGNVDVGCFCGFKSWF